MKNWKKISITTLSTLTIFGTVVFGATGTVNAPSGLVLRETASSSGNPITTLPNDAKIEIIEKTGDWYKVTYNSYNGYAFAQYIETEEEVSKPEEENEATTTQDETTNMSNAVNKLKVYNMPLITSEVINQIEPQAEITVQKELGSWSYVVSGSIQGWVRTYSLSNKIEEPQELPQEQPEEITKTTQEEQPANENKSEEKTTTVDTKPANNAGAEETSVNDEKGFVAVEYANIRKQASTDSEIVTTLTKGTSFKITAETEDWYKITYTDPDDVEYVGYIYKPLATK